MGSWVGVPWMESATVLFGFLQTHVVKELEPRPALNWIILAPMTHFHPLGCRLIAAMERGVIVVTFQFHLNMKATAEVLVLLSTLVEV